MEIKDLAGLSAPMTKVIEVLSDGCKSLFAPIQTVRNAKAEAKALEIRNIAEFKCRLRDAVVCNAIEQKNLSLRQRREVKNIEAIYSNAALELQQIGQISDIKVHPDWSSRFFDYAKDVSDEDAQIIWAKLLAGEIKSPGSFFKRTLDVLRNMESQEAKYFCEASKYMINSGVVLNPYPEKIHYNVLQSLLDCGLFTHDRCSIVFDKSPNEINAKTITLRIVNSFVKPPKLISLEAYAMTDAGLQLYKLIQEKSDKDYFTELKKHIEDIFNVEIEMVEK